MCVGDINNSGAITAGDAQIALNESVSPGSQTLSCPSGSTCTACTQTAIGNRLSALTSGERVLKGTSTIFRCPAGGTTITISSSWSKTISVNDVIISAKNRGITFESASAPTCPSSKPGTGYTFLRLAGDNIVLEDIKVTYFWNGVEIAGDNNTFRTNTGMAIGTAGSSSTCRTGVVNEAGATGTELRGLNFGRHYTAPNGSNGILSAGESINTTSPCTDANALHATSTDRSCYNLASFGSIMSAMEEPFDYSGKGRYLSYDDLLEANIGLTPLCERPKVHGGLTNDDLRVRMDGTNVLGCKTGLYLGSRAQVSASISTVAYNRIRGVWVAGNSTATLRDSDIFDNGGTSDSTNPNYGGVTTSNASATIDMGTSSSDPGNNVLCGNEYPGGYLQIDNNGGTINNVGNTVTNGACF